MGWVMKRLVIVISAMILAPSAAIAIVFGGSNLGFMGYPSHTCSPPYSKPIKPFQFTEQWQIDQYNSEVDTYNFELDTYRQCIKEYVENSANDIKRIKEKANEAISDANSQ
jgi:hypothetical protein